MTPTYQRNRTDCTRAAIATILDLPYEVVPDFWHAKDKLPNQLDRIEKYVKSLGLCSWITTNPKGYHLAVVYAKLPFEPPVCHSTVGYNGKIIFDPEPILVYKKWIEGFAICFAKSRPILPYKYVYPVPVVKNELIYDSKSERLALSAA